jgi:hypothetical protein
MFNSLNAATDITEWVLGYVVLIVVAAFVVHLVESLRK